MFLLKYIHKEEPKHCCALCKREYAFLCIFRFFFFFNNAISLFIGQYIFTLFATLLKSAGILFIRTSIKQMAFSLLYAF